MEKKLKLLFDYQRFEQNPRLEKLIGNAEAAFARELSDEELSMISAAGELTEAEKKPGDSPSE